MGSVKEPQRVIPVAGLLTAPDFRADLLGELEIKTGRVLLKSEPFPFQHTTYYEQEMGPGLIRQWCAFDKLVWPDALVDLKHMTNAMEMQHPNRHGGRRVNLDPGIVSLGNLILASTKNYSHRIYLGRGIYAEVTLIFRQQRFVPLDWTYPDYREEKALDFFTETREILKRKLTGFQED